MSRASRFLTLLELLDDELKDYKVKYIPHPGDWSKVAKVQLYYKGKVIGKMGMSGLSKADQDFYSHKGQKNLNYAMINWSEINPEHRGKGLYKLMLTAAVNGVKGQGSDGVSTQAQTQDSRRVWNSITNKTHLPPEPGSANSTFVLKEPPNFKREE